MRALNDSINVNKLGSYTCIIFGDYIVNLLVWDDFLESSLSYRFGCPSTLEGWSVVNTEEPGISFSIASASSSPLGVRFEEWGNRWWIWLTTMSGVDKNLYAPPYTQSGFIDCDYHYYVPPSNQNNSALLFLNRL